MYCLGEFLSHVSFNKVLPLLRFHWLPFLCQRLYKSCDSSHQKRPIFFCLFFSLHTIYPLFWFPLLWNQQKKIIYKRKPQQYAISADRTKSKPVHTQAQQRKWDMNKIVQIQRYTKQFSLAHNSFAFQRMYFQYVTQSNSSIIHGSASTSKLDAKM